MTYSEDMTEKGYNEDENCERKEKGEDSNEEMEISLEEGQYNPIKWKVRHVHGHQNNNLFQPLDRWAKWNAKVDYLSKADLHAIQEDLGGRK